MYNRKGVGPKIEPSITPSLNGLLISSNKPRDFNKRPHHRHSDQKHCPLLRTAPQNPTLITNLTKI